MPFLGSVGLEPLRRKSLVAGLGDALVAAGRDVQAIYGDTVAALSTDEAVRRQAMQYAAERSQMADEAYQRSTLPASVYDVKSIGDVPRLVGGVLGRSVPELAAISGALAVTGGAAAPVAAGRLASAAARVFGSPARVATGAAATTPLAAGRLLGEQREQSGTYNPATAFGLAPAYGLLNMVGGAEALLARGATSVTAGRLRNIAAAGGVGAAAEGLAEAGQTSLELMARRAVDGSVNLFDADARAKMLEAGLTGAVVGGVVEGTSGAFAPVRKVRQKTEEPLAAPASATQGVGGQQRPAVGLLPAPDTIPASEPPMGSESPTRSAPPLALPAPQPPLYVDSLGRISPELPPEQPRALPYAGVNMLPGGPTLYVDPQGTVDATPPPPKWLTESIERGPAGKPIVPPFDYEAARYAPLPPEKLDAPFVGTVRSMFTVQQIAQQVAQALPLKADGTFRKDPFAMKIATALGTAVAENQPVRALRVIRQQREALAASNLKPETIQQRKAMLDIAEQLLNIYMDRVNEALALSEVDLKAFRGRGPKATELRKRVDALIEPIVVGDNLPSEPEPTPLPANVQPVVQALREIIAAKKLSQETPPAEQPPATRARARRPQAVPQPPVEDVRQQVEQEVANRGVAQQLRKDIDAALEEGRLRPAVARIMRARLRAAKGDPKALESIRRWLETTRTVNRLMAADREREAQAAPPSAEQEAPPPAEQKTDVVRKPSKKPPAAERRTISQESQELLDKLENLARQNVIGGAVVPRYREILLEIGDVADPDARSLAAARVNEAMRKAIARAEGRSGLSQTETTEATTERARDRKPPKQQRGDLPNLISPETRRKATEALNKRLKQLGLSDAVVVRIVDVVAGNNRALGDYQEGIISVAAAMGENAPYTLDHEIIHFLHDVGLITPDEWALLEAQALADKALMERVRRDYAGLPESDIREEAVAEMFAEFARRRRQPQGIARKVWDYIQRVFRAIREALGDVGYKTADEIMRAIDEGRIAKRAENAAIAYRNGQRAAQMQQIGARLISSAKAAIEASDMLEASPQRWAKVLQDAGVSRGELMWTGILEALKASNTQKLSRTQVMALLEGSRMDIEEEYYGTLYPPVSEVQARKLFINRNLLALERSIKTMDEDTLLFERMNKLVSRLAKKRWKNAPDRFQSLAEMRDWFKDRPIVKTTADHVKDFLANLHLSANMSDLFENTKLFDPPFFMHVSALEFIGNRLLSKAGVDLNAYKLDKQVPEQITFNLGLAALLDAITVSDKVGFFSLISAAFEPLYDYASYNNIPKYRRFSTARNFSRSKYAEIVLYGEDFTKPSPSIGTHFDMPSRLEPNSFEIGHLRMSRVGDIAVLDEVQSDILNLRRRRESFSKYGGMPERLERRLAGANFVRLSVDDAFALVSTLAKERLFVELPSREVEQKAFTHLAVARALVEAINVDAAKFAWPDSRMHRKRSYGSFSFRKTPSQSGKTIRIYVPSFLLADLNGRFYAALKQRIPEARIVVQKYAVLNDVSYHFSHLEIPAAKLDVFFEGVTSVDGYTDIPWLSDVLAAGYKPLYDQQIPSIVEKLTGQKPTHNPKTNYWSIPLTPEFKARARAQGIRRFQQTLPEHLADPGVHEAAEQWASDPGPAALRNLAERLGRAKVNAGFTGRKVLLNLLTLRQMAELYPDSAVGDYTQAMAEAGAATRKLLNEARDILRKWNNLPEKEREQVGSFLLDATVANVDPRSETAPEDADEAVHYEVLREEYLRFTPEQKAVIDAVVNHFQKGRARKLAAFDKLAAESGITNDKTLQELRGHTESRIKFYFPLLRFGKYAVGSRSLAFVEADEAYARALGDRDRERQAAGGYLDDAREEEWARLIAPLRNRYEQLRKGGGFIFRTFDTVAEAKAWAAEQQAEGRRVTMGLRKDWTPALDAVSRNFLAALQARFVKLGYGDELLNIIREEFLRSLPDGSALKREMRRDSVVGYSKDARRAFAAASERDAYYIGRMEVASDVANALDSVAAWAEAQNTFEASQLLEAVREHHAAALDYNPNAFAQKATGVTYLWYLGANIAHWVVNSLQGVVVTLPKLWARYGSASFAKFAQAYRDVVPYIDKEGALDMDRALKEGAITPDERRMMQALLDGGLVDLSQAVELAQAALPTGGVESIYSTVAHYAALPNHIIEVVNRYAAALSAYRLAASKPFNERVEYAKEVVAQTHFDYSAENEPLLWKKVGAGRLILQFKKYQQGMLFLLGRNIALSLKGDREAMRLVGGIFFTHAFFAGLMGLPFAGLAFALANGFMWAFGDDDEPWDARVEFANFIANVMGHDDPDDVSFLYAAISRGMPSALGFDLSERIGLHDIAATTRVPQIDTDSPRQDAANLIVASLGPTAGIVQNAIASLGYAAADQWEMAVAAALPNALKAPFTAGRYAIEGGLREIDRTLAIDDMSVGEIAMQAMGFTPSRVARYFERRKAITLYNDMITDRRKILIRAYAAAVIDQDADAKQEAREAIQRYNQTVRARGLKPINEEALLRAVADRKRKEGIRVGGVAPARGQEELAELIAF